MKFFTKKRKRKSAEFNATSKHYKYEMHSKEYELLEHAYKYLKFSTFKEQGLNILRNTSYKFKYTSKFKVLDEEK